ncbi:hypothetical protein Ahia01_000604000 [Argonauta hians]
MENPETQTAREDRRPGVPSNRSLLPGTSTRPGQFMEMTDMRDPIPRHASERVPYEDPSDFFEVNWAHSLVCLLTCMGTFGCCIAYLNKEFDGASHAPTTYYDIVLTALIILNTGVIFYLYFRLMVKKSTLTHCNFAVGIAFNTCSLIYAGVIYGLLGDRVIMTVIVTSSFFMMSFIILKVKFNRIRSSSRT